MMIFSNKFDNREMQVDKYTFSVTDKKSIHIRLLEGEFQHFFVIVKNPHDKIIALLTFKTRKYDYYLINADSYTNNTLPCDIENGVWHLEVVRTYRIINGYKISVDFEEPNDTQNASSINPIETKDDEIVCENSEWYRGDLHMHSYYSDGRISLEDIQSSCIKQDLSYFALTDHSVITTKFPCGMYLVIPGTEITWDDLGHYNVWGIHELIDYGHYVESSRNKSLALDHLFADLKKKNAVLSFNHPFPNGWHLGHDFNINIFDTIEVINAPHLIIPEIDNEKAVKLFDFMWKNNILLQGVGGSDSHKKNYFQTYPVGIPCTSVYCEGLSLSNLLNGIKNGNSYISTYEEFEILFYKEGNTKKTVLPGMYFEGEADMVARCKQPVSWELVKNGEVVEESYGKSFHKKIHIEQDDYYRLQARQNDEIILFVNPLHAKKRREGRVMLQTLLHAFEEGTLLE